MTDLVFKVTSIGSVVSLNRVAMACFTVLLACMQGALGIESATACRISHKKWIFLLFLEIFIVSIAFFVEMISVIELMAFTRKRFQWLLWLSPCLLLIGIHEILIDVWYTVITGIHSRLYWIPLTFHTRRGTKRQVAVLLGYIHALYVFSIAVMSFILLVWRQNQPVGKPVDAITAMEASKESFPLSAGVMGFCAGLGMFQCVCALVSIFFLTYLSPRGDIGQRFRWSLCLLRIREFKGSFNPSTFFGKYANKYSHLNRERTGEGVRLFELLHGIQYGQVPKLNAVSLSLTPLHVNNVKLGKDKNMFVKGHEFLGVSFRMQSILRFVDGTYPLLLCLVAATRSLRNQLDYATFDILQHLVDTILVFVLVGLGFRLKKCILFFGYEDDVHDKDRTAEEPRSTKNSFQKWLQNSRLKDRRNEIDPGSSIASDSSDTAGKCDEATGDVRLPLDMPALAQSASVLKPQSESLDQIWTKQWKKFKSFYRAVGSELQLHVPTLSEQEIEDVERMKLSEYLTHGSTIHHPFLEYAPSVFSKRAAQNFLSNPDGYFVSYPTPDFRRLVIQSSFDENFMILIDDFFLVFDEMYGVFHVRVTGSPEVEISIRDLKDNPRLFDDFIGKIMTIQQVYLLARRFVQFTGAKWDYACLANVEMNLPGASILRLPDTRKFADIVLDLYPMNFDMLSSCTVGYLDIDQHTFYSVGMKAFGSVIAFQRSKSFVFEEGDCQSLNVTVLDSEEIDDENDIAQPIMLEGAILQKLNSHTDDYKLLIGGNDHRNVAHWSDVGSTSEVISEENRRSPLKVKHLLRSLRRKMCFQGGKETIDMHTSNARASPCNGAASVTTAVDCPNLSFISKSPSELSHHMVDNRQIYNLAPVPKNKLFHEIQRENEAEGHQHEVIEEAEMDPGTVNGYGADHINDEESGSNGYAHMARRDEHPLNTQGCANPADPEVSHNTVDSGACEDEKRYFLFSQSRNGKKQCTLDDMKDDFLKLGYGEQLSDLIRCCARKKWNWKDYPGISLIEAQHILLKTWDAITHKSMLPFTMTGKKYIQRDEHFLIINSGKLKVAQTTRPITHSFTIGIGAKVEGVGPSLAYTRASKKADVIEISEVWSVLDAIELITGKRDKNFMKFTDGHASFLTPPQMEEFLGPLLFVLFLLGDKAKGEGRFKNCLVGNESITKQSVRFDVPIPFGVLCSTLARVAVNDKKCMLVDGDWDFNRDFDHFVFLGVEPNDTELLELVTEHKKA